MKRMLLPRHGAGASRGFSLVELLVAMAIGLILTLAITTVMSNSEGAKRSITSTNDANQTGTYVSYVLDRALRSAGSGYSQRWNEAFGCRINASRDNEVMLPRGMPLPAPFAAMPTTVALAPVIITKGAGANASDVLTIMTGTGGFGETAQRVMPSSITSAGLRLPNTLGLRGNDLVLLVEDGLGCMLQQIQSGFVGTSDQQLTFSGRYHAATGTSVSMASYGAAGTSTTYALHLGNAVDNAPMFQMVGVGANNTLMSYDLLRIADADEAVPIAEGVVQMRALYGVDTTGDGRQDVWVDPGTAPYDAATLLDGSAGSRLNLRRIVSVRLGLVVRGTSIERQAVSPASLTLFDDLGAPFSQPVALSEDERKQRHRVIEVTVPLRNVLLLPAV
jgi:type IV pilus assembly protein PilW